MLINYTFLKMEFPPKHIFVLLVYYDGCAPMNPCDENTELKLLCLNMRNLYRNVNKTTPNLLGDMRIRSRHCTNIQVRV